MKSDNDQKASTLDVNISQHSFWVELVPAASLTAGFTYQHVQTDIAVNKKHCNKFTYIYTLKEEQKEFVMCAWEPKE